MPIYNSKCTSCNYEEEVLLLLKDIGEKLNCTKCGKESKRLFTPSKGAIVWGTRIFEHLDTEPVVTTSLKQLKEEARKRDKIVPAYM